MSSEAKIYPCVPVDWLWMPKPVRKIVGWITVILFNFIFFTPLFTLLLFLPVTWKHFPYTAGAFALSLIVSMTLPSCEWIWFRKVGQLWYEIFDFSCSLSPEKCLEMNQRPPDAPSLILAMHPHGIIPLQAVFWATYCGQYLPKAYGFGAAADAALYVPFLRNIMGYLAAGSATYQTLKRGLVEGYMPAVNRASGRKPHNLYILPGGVAEIFTSKPGIHEIVFLNRKGIIRLALETKAELTPCYVFGGTDFFQNLATSDSWLSRMSRKFRVGVAIFWGQYGLPIPFQTKVTMVIGDPIPVRKELLEGDSQGNKDFTKFSKEKQQEMIDALHGEFLAQMQILFDSYKAVAGYPDAKLIIR